MSFRARCRIPPVFGLAGFVPLSTVPAGVGENVKVYPDLANAKGIGSHVDFTWKLHGIPSYVYSSFKLSKVDLEKNNYRIVASVNVKDDSEVIGGAQYKVVRTVARARARALEKRLDCSGGDTPPAPQGSPTAACHSNHAATLEDCAPLYYLMRLEKGLCRLYDEGGRTGAMYRSCGLVAQRGRKPWQCIAWPLIADYALPIIDQCWPRDVPKACTNWRSGVIEGTDTTPKTCACNSESVGKC